MGEFPVETFYHTTPALSCSYLEYLMAEYYEMAERSAERLRGNSSQPEEMLLAENEALTQQLNKIQRQMTMIERVFERYNSTIVDEDTERAAADVALRLLPPITADLRSVYIGDGSRNFGAGDSPRSQDSIPTQLPAIRPQSTREGTRSPRSRNSDRGGSANSEGKPRALLVQGMATQE